ncbi:hypothetical protein D3C87_1090820 [compost metagenome]
MATVKQVQTITTSIHMRKVTIRNQQSVLTFFEGEPSEIVMSSLAYPVDLDTKDYWNIHDERDGRRYVVEFPKGTFKGNQQLVTKKLLEEYVQWSSLCFGEWENRFKGKVIALIPENLTPHATAPLPDQDRLYYWTWPDSDRLHFRYGVKKHKRYAQPTQE